ncbi:hypothetical protein CLF_110809 [Clonorchis sinensis]|uniref:Uncharacterized protein n=1 Tax=Clonorchis sinensis TaxID=79923 RepID=G7YTW7_CLOSI|nr:hypothetical protein CLF_110809 [Clonorchis sinensis]
MITCALFEFRSVFEIPNELFTRRLKLRGVVASVSFDGELKIIHLPRMCFIYRSDAGKFFSYLSLASDCALPVVLPLTHSRRSIEWMRATFTGQPQIRFVPIGLDHANGRLVAMIYVKQVLLLYFETTTSPSLAFLFQGYRSFPIVRRSFIPVGITLQTFT